MKDYLPESMRRCPPGYARGELERAMEEGTILTARAVRCDETHDLIIYLGCAEGRIPRLEAAEGVADGRTREIAILRCVGRPVCACVTEITPEGEIVLSRRKAQQLAMDHLLREAAPGDILPAVVTGCTAFGAFCDVGCGAAALLGTQQLCISRLRHAGELLTPGQRIYAAIRTLDRVQRRVFLTQRELLGTWAENAARFCAGQTVIGVARSLTDYGAFIELTPNLSGLAEDDGTLRVGDHVAVYIRAIVPETLKIKLSVLHRVEPQPREPLRYFQTEGHIRQWRYGNEEFAKYYTIF